MNRVYRPAIRPQFDATVSLITAFLLFGYLGGCTHPATATQTLHLSWDAPSQNADGTPIGSIAGYHIYVGSDSQHLVLRGGVTGAASTSYAVTGLNPGTYCFAVGAYTVLGVESPHSAVNCKTL